MTRSWAPVRPKGRPFRNGLRRLPSPRCLPPISVLSTRALRAARPAWIRKSSWKIETTHRRLQARPLGREVDLVDGVVQIRQAVAHEDLGRQRVEDAARRVEGAVDERPHPAGLYVLVDGVDGDEAPGVRPFVARPDRR